MQYQNLVHIIKHRRSIRNFNNKAISNDLVIKIIESGIWAPSSSNIQGWKFQIINDKNSILELAQIVDKKAMTIEKSLDDEFIKESFQIYRAQFSLFKRAPVIILVFQRKMKDFIQGFFDNRETAIRGFGSNLSLGMVLQNMALTAYSLNIGSCVFTGPLLAEKELKEHLRYPNTLELGAILSLGYTDNLNPIGPGRKEIDTFLLK